jgi:hypothetical protein
MSRVLWCALLAVAVVTAGLVSAEAQTTASISGVVRDNSGGVIPRATVVVKDDGPGLAFEAVTGADGSSNEAAYFWLTGVLSAFLDNAPTYLVFFQLAGGDAATLMGELAPTLAAISMGAVYMGALTYIGNAPNFMVYAIASERGIAMPSFFGYMLWSCAVLLPVFALLSVFGFG